MKQATRYSLLMGAICAPAGVGVGWIVASTATGSGYEYFFAYAGAAAFLTGAVMWWLVIERPGKATRLRGAAAGGWAGILAHWACWYLVIVSLWLCNQVTGGCVSSLGDAPMNPLQAMPGAAAFSLWSLLLFGIVTVPYGAIAGLVLAGHRRKATGSPTTRG